MATYNGEKYVAQQLDSMLAQTYPNVHIYVLDDGSKDKTMDILREYEKKGVHIVENDQNLGYPYSFFKLMETCTGADYYCLSDQDDVWLPEKVERAVEKLSRMDPNEENLYFSAFEYCDENLTPVRKSAPVPAQIPFYKTFFQCYLWGFTVVMNEKMRAEYAARFPERTKAKDYWMHMLCGAFGNFVTDDRVCAMHRRHGKNHSEDPIAFFHFQMWRIKNFLFENQFAVYHDMLKEFYSYYKDRLPEQQREMLELFQSDGKRWKKICFPHRLRSTWADEIMLRCCFLIGKL